MRTTCYFALLAILLSFTSPLKADERIDVPEVGFALTVPEGWRRVAGDEAFAHLRNVRLDREEFQNQLARGQEPIVSLRRITSEQPLTPIVNVGFRQRGALAGQTPVQILERTALVGRRAFSDFEVLETPQQLTVSGLPSARLRAAYTQTQQGRRLRNVSEYWLILRGEYYFFVSAGYHADEAPAIRQEIERIFASLEVRPN